NRRWTRLLQRGLSYTGLLCVAALTLWGLYGFEVRPLPEILNGILPLPAAAHIERGLRLQDNLAYGRETFLLGQNGMHGWWYYFPIAFALKTPLPLLILLGVSLLRIMYRGLHRELHVSQLTLYAFPLLYAISALFSPLNIGYRHLLPLLPFLYIGIASCQSKKPLRNTQYARRFTFYVLLIWLAFGALALAPHYLTFFNEIAGGPENGWRWLADSNTDWGQGYQELAAFQEQAEIEHFNLSAFIFYDPALYGVRYTPLTPYGGNTPAIFPSRFAPPAGDYAISATTLDGIPLADPEMYDWFRWREPEARLGNALFYYHISAAETEGSWLAQCVTPTIPLNTEAIQAGFGNRTLRKLTFDCTQSWLIPQNGEPGYYALHGALLQDDWRTRLHYTPPRSHDTFIVHHLTATRIAYQQREYGASPAFALYHATTPPSEPIPPGVWMAPAATPPQDLTPSSLQQPPLALDGPLTHLGSRLTRSDDARLEIETWWQVTQGSISRPLSIMAHLITAAGETLEVADGLGVPPDSWQTGDIIIQRHQFSAHAGKLYLRTGAYWQADGVRWSLATNAGADAIFIPLSTPETP
ncbi:MAG: hypothetical protein U9Q70_05715, partial [Chloroflexota bacterium]|nr:hypothetical protein [Chloroflexota bacterium]